MKRFIRKWHENGSITLYSLESKKGKKVYEAFARENNLLLEIPDPFDLPFEPTFLRVGRRGENYYHDLCNGNIVKINKEGFSVGKCAVVNFLKKDNMLSLPKPARAKANLSDLRKYLNVDDEGYLLVISYLVFSLIGEGTYPVMLIHGPHGSSKSTLLKILKSIIDPNPVSLNSLPKNTRDAAIVTQDQYLVSFDNVSKLSQELSDFFCRLSTGGSFQTRKLFSDSKTLTLTYHKPTILNGLLNFVSKADLRSRVLSIKTKDLSDKRISEKDLWIGFNSELPFIMGGLYSLCCEVLKVVDMQNYQTDQRMVDFCRVSRAVFEILASDIHKESTEKYFNFVFSKYVDNNLDILLEDPVYLTIVDLVKDGEWKGKSQDLIREVDRYCSKYRISKTFIPSSPGSMGRHISLMEPLLRNSPVEYKELRNREKKFSKKPEVIMESNNS